MAKSSFYATTGPSAEQVQTLADLIAQAQAAAAAAAVSADNVDDLYLGAKAVAPTLDNDGNALQAGALYFNTVSNTFWAWNGFNWIENSGGGGGGGASNVIVLHSVSGANVITGSGYVTQTAWITGAVYVWKQTSTNSGAATLSPDGQTARSIKKYGNDVGVGDLFAGTWYAAMNDGTNLQLILSGAML